MLLLWFLMDELMAHSSWLLCQVLIKAPVLSAGSAHTMYASMYKATPSLNKSLVGKKICMQAADRKGRLLKHTWHSGSSCLPETQTCFQSLLGQHFLLQAFEAKTLDSRPQVLSPKSSGKREKGWYLMGRWPPKEMTEFLQHLWEIPQSSLFDHKCCDYGLGTGELW